MPNEAILIVDDAPVNLKLTGILLRKEGYDVHTAVDAEQALKLLESFHPDLILVDIQLPGLDGLELTRRVKRNEQTRDVVVIALTACAMKGDEEKAYQAGCDGYITKPIETAALAGRIRDYLEHRGATPSAAAHHAVARLPGGLSLTHAEREGLQRRFLESATVQVRHMMESLTRGLEIESALRTCRGWADAAAILDYDTIVDLANDVEQYLKAPAVKASEVEEALSNLMVGLVEAPESSPGPVPGDIVEALKGQRVALAGFAADDAERLCVALERASAKPRYFDHVSARDSDPVRDCSVMVVDVNASTRGTFLLAAGAAAFSGPLLVLAGNREEILALDHSVQLRAAEFLIDGWQPEEALMRISYALSRQAIAMPARRVGASRDPINRGPEVLVADDDLTVRQLLRGALENAGIRCRTAATGPEALQMMRDHKPAAAVLDVNMPGMDGYEVLSAARQEALPVRVMLFTARQQDTDINRGFDLGADDYLVKPFDPLDLVVRLKRLLRN